jgi:HlyD family secretion protein
MNIVDLSDIWVVFNIREDLLTNIRVGKDFEATVPALGNEVITLKVNYIKAMASYATFKATKTNGGFRYVYKTKNQQVSQQKNNPQRRQRCQAIRVSGV